MRHTKTVLTAVALTISLSIVPLFSAEKLSLNKNSKNKSKVSQIDSITRQVEVQSKGGSSWKKAQNKMTLSTDDKIRTGRRSVARMKLLDGSKVLLLQNSQAEMENLSSVEKTIKLLKGRIRAVVAKIKGGNNFKVKTPVGVASVRGTDFEVEVSEEGDQMNVSVLEGQVGVSKLGVMADEVVLNAGEKISFGAEGEMGAPEKSGSAMDQQEVRSEIMNSQVKDAVLAMAAEESRSADFQVGKSLIDVHGQRVRVEEYITRPQSNQFKLVVLNDRPDRFDYFTYKGTFNTTLPEDLSIALRQVGGTLGSASPDYYLTAYESLMSNTIDNIIDSGSGGHLVRITFDGTYYTLTDPTDPTNTRTIEAAALQNDGTYRIYNPRSDSFTTVSAANRDEALKVSVLDSTTGAYRNLASGDTLWRTRYNSNSFTVNNVTKTAFSKKSGVTNTLAIDFDADFTNRPILTISENPSGSAALHNRLTLYYADGSKLTYNNYIINDEGKIAPASSFQGLSNSADYQTELNNWNYEQDVTATEMGNRSIRLVIDPRIGTISGLIQ